MFSLLYLHQPTAKRKWVIKEIKMTNSNWMVTLAIAQRKALINIGYPVQQVSNMSLADTTKELKSIGYDFKANSPLKNK
jgi:hypothetical protein